MRRNVNNEITKLCFQHFEINISISVHIDRLSSHSVSSDGKFNFIFHMLGIVFFLFVVFFSKSYSLCTVNTEFKQ